jgi:hypothetical protein
VVGTKRIEIGDLPFEATGSWDGTTMIVEAAKPAGQLQAAIDAAPDPAVQEQVGAAERTFIKARLPGMLAKARAIMADPQNAPDFTAAEQKVIRALIVIDMAQRR